MMSTKSADNMPTQRITVVRLITEDMGYCCPHFFFKRFRLTGLIAARLGMSKRAVQYAKARVNSGCSTCEHKPNCMARYLHVRSSMHDLPKDR